MYGIFPGEPPASIATVARWETAITGTRTVPGHTNTLYRLPAPGDSGAIYREERGEQVVLFPFCPVVDQVAATWGGRPEWTITVEGQTESAHQPECVVGSVWDRWELTRSLGQADRALLASVILSAALHCENRLFFDEWRARQATDVSA